MTSLADMNEMITKRVGSRITKFCAPLVEHLGISHVYHFLLTETGHYACTGLHQDWHECFFAGDGYLHTPYYRHPRVLQGGLFFAQTFQNEKWQHWMQIAAEKYNVHLSLQIMVKTDEGCEAFGFALNTGDPLRHMALVNHLPQLSLFMNQYKNEFGSSILKDNLADMGSLLGPTFNEPSPIGICPNPVGKMLIQVPVPFTAREGEVLRELLKGYTAPMIGEKLFISKRTAEHHLERLKEKFDCTTKAELVQKAKQYESTGYIF